MPHIIALAPSGRAKCRACKTPILKASLRLGEEVPNAFGDGQATHWYHLLCGARRRPEAFLEAWGSRLESDDAEKAEDEPTAEQAAEMIAIAEKGKEHYRLGRFVRAQTAPSGRAKCQGCRELIEKGALRFVLERIEDGMVAGAGFVHVGCAHKYAGAVDGIEERVRPLSELTDEQWSQVTAALEEQAKLPPVKIEPGGVAE